MAAGFFPRENFSGNCDASGNGTVKIRIPQSFYVLGYFAVQVSLGVPTYAVTLGSSSLPLIFGQGNQTQLGPVLIQPGELISLVVTGAAPSATISGQLLGWQASTAEDLLPLLPLQPTAISLSPSNAFAGLPYGALGHYRSQARIPIVNAQAAAAHLWSLRNAGSNLFVLLRLQLRFLQTGAHTAAIEASIDVYRATGFTVDDSTNASSPAISLKRTGMGPQSGGNSARTRAATVGVAAGMTSGVMTLEAAPFARLPQFLQAAAPTAGTIMPMQEEVAGGMPGNYPHVLGQNEGLVVTNGILLGAAANDVLYLDCEWAELASF